MKTLRIDSAIAPLLDTLAASRRGILIAPPGAGKSTRVPPAMLRAGLLDRSHPAVIVLQPRRVAARAVASRIADERGWTLGHEVGYHVRFERKLGPKTLVRVLTEGLLNRLLLADAFLDGVGAVVLDEFHERSLHADLALGLLREIQESVRPDLILLVMSATMDAAPVSAFLRDAPVIEAPGRSFPVEIKYRPTPPAGRLDAVAAAVVDALEDDLAGDVLVFLPGAEEIRRVARSLETFSERTGVLIAPLHGQLPTEQQDLALRPAGRRKIILATNIAETSLTIEGVTTVIDSGMVREASFDPVRGLDRLELGRISRASATQRAGRAGRIGPGRCIRLWSEGEQRGMAENDVPEIRRVDLTAATLALHAWGQSDPTRFGWFEAPPIERLDAARKFLADLGAVDDRLGMITPLGRRMLEFPAHPRLARLLIAASDAGFPREGAALAALLSEKDVAVESTPGEGFRGPRKASSAGTSDLFDRLDRLDQAEQARFSPTLRQRGIDPHAARRVSQARDQLSRAARTISRGRDRGGQADEATLARMILLAYPDRVARRRAGDPLAGVLVGGRGVRLAPDSVVRDSEFFLALDPREDRRGGVAESRCRLACAILPEWLEEDFPDAIRREMATHFDEARGKVVTTTSTWYRDLLLRQVEHSQTDAGETSRALSDFLKGRALAFLREDEAAAGLLDRLAFLAESMPDAGIPLIDDQAVGAILESACQGRRSLQEVCKQPLASMVRGLLTHAQGRILDEQAPESLLLPSGNRARLSYEAGRPPVLAARLQELFGWTKTPKLAGGRVAVVVHLLGPNYRPVQVTDDLASFWSNAYFQVRKDLRNRYPKHSWPEDPLTAKAEARGGRRQT
ncbi:ATP-dependent helicase HrpB [Isosphaeraceae bacterium EP7]